MPHRSGTRWGHCRAGSAGTPMGTPSLPGLMQSHRLPLSPGPSPTRGAGRFRSRMRSAPPLPRWERGQGGEGGRGNRTLHQPCHPSAMAYYVHPRRMTLRRWHHRMAHLGGFLSRWFRTSCPRPARRPDDAGCGGTMCQCRIRRFGCGYVETDNRPVDWRYDHPRMARWDAASIASASVRIWGKE